MTVIIDNKDPYSRPSVPVPAGLNKSVPNLSDTILYQGPVWSGRPYVWGEFPNMSGVTIRRITRARTWVLLTQFHTHPGSGGSYNEQATEGVSTAVGSVQRWEANLGLEVTAGWGPFSATMSASLSRGGESSVTVELYSSISRTIQFNFEKGVEAEVAAWQLEEKFSMDCWRFVFANTDPSKVSDAMIAACKQKVESALQQNTKPQDARYFVLPSLIAESNQYTMSSFPQMAGANLLAVKPLAATAGV